MIARLIARFAHQIVAEFRELDVPEEQDKNPVGFTIPRTDAGPCYGDNCDHVSHKRNLLGVPAAF